MKTPFRTNTDVEYAVFVDGDKTQILVYTQNQDYFKRDSYEIEFAVNTAASNVTAQIIDDTHCNPKKEWEKLGSPDNLTLAQVEEIKKTTALKEEKIDFEVKGNETIIPIRMQVNDVILITVS